MLKRGANPHCSPAQALVGWFCRWTRCEKRGGREDCLSWDASALFKQTLTRSKQSAFQPQLSTLSLALPMPVLMMPVEM
jgi:hypothetical protein